MRTIYRQVLLFLLLFFFLFTKGQEPKREFRGVWVATVNHLDWPSKPGAPAEEQQAEMVAMLDTLEKLHFNAVIFQVRPAGDAMYKSGTEPWSAYLTGEQGKAPDQRWDPLEFIVNECHKRGMELHAWFNPYRISQNPKDVLAETSIANRHPEWMVEYGGKRLLDPGFPEVRDYLVKVVAEVVSKYDVDAVHFDDYFYPYAISGQRFPDTLSFRLNHRGYDSLHIADWRRENVDLTIEALYKSIKRIKPRVKFGISPFGVWRNASQDPRGSATTGGTNNYDNLYADVLKWLDKGWVDYLIPQLYWEIGNPLNDFITLEQWWGNLKTKRHIYIGHALYKTVEADADAWRQSQEIPKQVLLVRRNKNLDGEAFFRYQYIENNPYNLAKTLSENFYSTRSLLPTMPWVDKLVPNPPSKVKAKGFINKKSMEMIYENENRPPVDKLGYLIYSSSSKKFDLNNPANIVAFITSDNVNLDELPLPKGKKMYLTVTVLDKHHNESRAVGRVRYKSK